MVKHYFKTLLRLIKKRPGFYLLNVSALSISLATFILIYQYAAYHFNFDKFHPSKDNIYRVALHYSSEGREPYSGAAVFPRVGPAMVDEFPEVIQQCRIVQIPDKANIFHRDQHFPVEHIQYVDTTFFDMFGYNLLSGHPKKSLQHLRSVVISDRIARTLFGEEDPMNQSLRIQTVDGALDFLVGGVFEYREDTHLKSEILISFVSLLDIVGIEANHNWSWFDYVTYVKLNPNHSDQDVIERLPAFIDRHGGERLGSKFLTFTLQPIEDIHLKSHLNQEIEHNADYESIVFLILISGLVLLIAWINYINLNTAKGQERAKEVAVRKTTGSTRSKLFFQFMFESTLLNLLSFCLALFMVVGMAPIFRSWLSIELDITLVVTPIFLTMLLSFFIVSTLVSGLYPSIFLSKLQPMRALNVHRARTNKLNIRKIMITWQLIASTGLLIITMVIRDQVDYMNSRPLGVQVADTYAVEVLDYDRNPNKHISKINRIKNELRELPGITKVNYSSDVPGKQVNRRGSSYRVDQSNALQSRELIMKMTVGPDFIEDYKIELLSGRNYTSINDTLSLIINHAAMLLYGFDDYEDALNSYIYLPGDDTLRIVGIADNFHQESLKERFKPTAFILSPREVKYISFGVRKNASLDDAVSIIETNLPNHSIEPILISDNMASMHHEETVFLRAFNLFMYLAIFLSAVGIVGFVSFTISKKEKEIAVRKVLGSDIILIVWNVLREVIFLVVMANVLLLPFVYSIATSWLDEFAFHTNFNWWFPVFSFILGLILVVFCSFSHVWRVANQNPTLILNKEK